MTLRVAHLVKNLENYDFRILRAIEKLRMKHEYAPIELLPKITKFSPSFLNEKLKNLHKHSLLVKPTKKLPFEGIDLTFNGFDVLALKALTDQDILHSFGDQIGMGKESDVFLASSENSQLFVVKIHRLGKAEFREIRRKRSYIAERRHISHFYESRLAAEREFEGLTRLCPYIRVPKPLAINRHIIVMEFIDGDLLNKIKHLTEKTSKQIFEEIIEMISISFNKANIIHGDLSEFNIMLTRDNLEPILFDYPQFLYSKEPGSKELFQRDVRNICHFFTKRFKANLSSTSELIKSIWSDCIDNDF